jgi:hypothetical protein
MTRLQPAARPTMSDVAADLAAWIRRTPEPLDLQVADLRGRFRAQHSAAFAARDQQHEWREQALVAVRALQERIRPLNDALRQFDPEARIDTVDDKLTNNVLGTRHSHWGRETLFRWVRCSLLTIGEEHWPYGLRMGRCVELLDDGTLVAQWLLNVGSMRGAGSDFNRERRDFEAPVGTLQQEEMLDRFAADLRSALSEALTVLVDEAGTSG